MSQQVPSPAYAQQGHTQHDGQHHPIPLAGGSGDRQTVPGPNGDSGNAHGVGYAIRHRNTNSILELNLPPGASIKAKSGAMVHMQPTVTLQGKVKVSMKKLFTGGDLAESIYTGPGRVSFAPALVGDIVPLHVSQGQTWTLGRDAFLASTQGITRELKSQGFRKTLFSGEDLFVYRVTGEGTLWLTSYGAIETLPLAQGEQHIVDNGHLVAWNCEYQIEKAGGSGSHAVKTGEGLVCRFTGPGMVYIQTRNLDEFGSWVREQVPSRG